MAKKYRVVVFGNLPIASKVVIELQNNRDIELAGVVISDKYPHNNDPWRDVPCMFEFCNENNIEIIPIEELAQRFGKQELVPMLRVPRLPL